MKFTYPIAVVASLCLAVGASASATVVTTKKSVNATVTTAASSSAQLAQAARLWQQLEKTPAPQKFDLFAQAWSNLTVVRKAWPNDTSAVVRSGVMQADLASEFRLWSKAVGALQEVLPAAAKTPMEPQVEQKLGHAYDMSGDAADAETHFLAAERAMHSVHSNRVDSQTILSSIALFYARQNNPAEAIRRFKEAEDLPGQNAVNKIHYQLSVLEQAARISRDVAAPEAARFDDLVLAARRTTLSPVDATVIDHMTQHAQKIRDKVRI